MKTKTKTSAKSKIETLERLVELSTKRFMFIPTSEWLENDVEEYREHQQLSLKFQKLSEKLEVNDTVEFIQVTRTIIEGDRLNFTYNIRVGNVKSIKRNNNTLFKGIVVVYNEDFFKKFEYAEIESNGELFRVQLDSIRVTVPSNSEQVKDFMRLSKEDRDIKVRQILEGLQGKGKSSAIKKVLLSEGWSNITYDDVYYSLQRVIV